MPKGMGYGKGYKMAKGRKSTARKASSRKVAPGRKNQLKSKM